MAQYCMVLRHHEPFVSMYYRIRASEKQEQDGRGRHIQRDEGSAYCTTRDTTTVNIRRLMNWTRRRQKEIVRPSDPEEDDRRPPYMHYDPSTW
jgi:hypothetical protein